jgi:tyrosyl-tRNA synthetase
VRCIQLAIENPPTPGERVRIFNLLLARDIQRAYGQPEQAVLTMPILPGIDGVDKMSKTTGNHIGVTEPPGEIYGRTLSLPDEALATWFSLLAVPEPPEGTSPRDAKHALARALVERFHGPDAAETAAEEFIARHVRHELPDEVVEATVSASDGVVHLPAALADAFGMSRSEARRVLAQGGVKLEGRPLDPGALDVPRERVDGAVVQVGKRNFRRLRVR